MSNYKASIKKLCIASSVLAAMSFSFHSALAADVSDFNTLKSEIQKQTSNINITNNINFTDYINVSAGNITINGNSNSFTSDTLLHRAFNTQRNAALTLEDLTVENFQINNTSNPSELERGAAVYSNGTLNIVNSKFINNKTNNNQVSSSNFTSGGAVFGNSGTLTITGSEFSKNEARRGGAVATADSSSALLNITDTLFSENSATFGGAAISNGSVGLIKNTTFNDNTVSFSSSSLTSNGGAAISNTGILQLTGTNNFNNNISGRNGGAILNRENSGTQILILDTANFIGNQANSTDNANLNGGGAIANFSNFIIGEADNYTVLNFENNSTTQHGGAILNNSNFHINAITTFKGNSANRNGGAIYNSDIFSINSENDITVFENNRSNNFGGAIYNSATLTLTGNADFKNNTASSNGGAIYNSSQLILDGNSSFTGNISSNGIGGAIYNEGSLIVHGAASFINNQAKGYGGAIYNAKALTITGQRNDSGDASILFKENSVNDAGGNLGDGGAICVAGQLNISGVDFIGNSSTNRAGAVRGNEGSKLNINNSKFIQNTTRKFGGAISTAGEVDIFVSNSYFEENSSISANSYELSYGGAITNGKNLTILNTEFYNNTAKNYGGAVSFNGSSLSIIADGKDTIFSGNTSGTTGNKKSDGLYIYNTTPTVNFNAGNGGSIIFDDKVTYSNNNRILTVNINSPSYYSEYDSVILNTRDGNILAPTNGSVIFNNTVSNMNLSVKGGTLVIGADTTKLNASDNYFSNSSLELDNATLNLANYNIENGNKLSLNNFTVNGNSYLQMDVNLVAGTIDYIDSAIRGNGTLTINKLNFKGGWVAELGDSQTLQFVRENYLDNTEILKSISTVITSDSGYHLGLDTTNQGKDSLKITKTVNAGGLPVAVAIGQYFDTSTYVYSATTDEIVNDWNIAFQVFKDTTTIDANGTNILQGSELVIEGNGKNTISSTNYSDGIVVGNGKTIDISNVKDWNGFTNAFTNNDGTININATNLSNNRGAIQNNSGTVNITNSNLTNNSENNGGAIYNKGIVNIIAENTDSIIFSGNGTVIFNDGGTTNFAAEKNGSITINDKISGANGFLNILRTNEGTVTFNDNVSNSAISVNGGTLAIGKDVSQLTSSKYFENVSLSLNGAKLDVQNKQIDNFDVNSLTINNTNTILLDVDLSGTGSSDKIIANAISCSGSITVGPINITNGMNTGVDSIITEFVSGTVNSDIDEVNKSITIDGIIYSVNVNNNQLIISKEGTTGGLAYEVINTAHLERTYTVGSYDESVHWINGDNNLAGTRLQILGGSNGKSIIGNSNEGIIVSDGQELNINEVASYNGFDSAVVNNGGYVDLANTLFENNNATNNGGVIANNAGTLYVNAGNIFKNNSAANNGGAIYNNAELILNTYDVGSLGSGNIVFEGNTAGGAGNDIYQTEYGKLTITGNNGGSVILNGGIAGSGTIAKSGRGNLILNSDNSGYTGSYVQDGIHLEIGDILTAGNTIVNSGAKFFQGETTINDSTLEWNTANDLDYSGTQKPKLTVNSGNLIVGNGGKLTIDNGGSIADIVDVTISGTGNLISKVDMTVNGNISGNGTFIYSGNNLVIKGDNSQFEGQYKQTSGTAVVQNDATMFKNVSLIDAILEFTGNGTMSSSSVLTSENSNIIISSNSDADAIIDTINSGTNENLILTLDNSNTSADLNISLPAIQSLDIKNNVTYTGKITGDSVINKTTDGVFNVDGDSSGFNGNFNQSSGATIVKNTGKLFGGVKNINGGSLTVNSNDGIYYDNVKLAGGTELVHNATSNVGGNITSSIFEFINGAEGAKATFTSVAGKPATYNIANAIIGNGKTNTVSFENSKVTLGTSDYTGSTIYTLNNSTLNLSNNTLENITFDNLTTTNTNKLDFDIKFAANGKLDTDTLTINNGGAKFNVGNVLIKDAVIENGEYKEYTTNTDVLIGAEFETITGGLDIAYGATTIYEYVMSITDDKHSIILKADGFSDEYSLNRANIKDGNRFFNFSYGNEEEYHIGASLEPTNNGVFYVNGANNNASDSILSGLLKNTTSDEKGSLFNIASNITTELHVNNLTIQDTYKNGNGSVLENNSTTSSATFENVIIKNTESSGNGGAIYNNGGTIIVNNSKFENNAAASGGAIYNQSGELNLTNVTLAAGQPTTSNDIYNNGTANTHGTNIFNSNFTNDGNLNLSGQNTFKGKIFGANSGNIENNGTLNLIGDASAYTGNFNQIAGTTTVTGSFFEGNSVIENGILNWLTTHEGTNAKLTMNDGILNVGNGKDNAILSLHNGSSIADKVEVDIHKNAQVNLASDGSLNLDNKDRWNGIINNEGGTLTTTGLTNASGAGGGLIQLSGTSVFKDNSHIFITDKNSVISGGDVSILNNSSLYLGPDTFDLGPLNSLTLGNNSSLNILNGVLDESKIDNMVINGNNSFSVDLAPRSHEGDTFIIENLTSDSSGVINIGDFNFIGAAPIDKEITFKIFDASNIGDVTFADPNKSIMTPIGNYQLYSQGNGSYTAGLTSFNPQVFRGQVATMAMYNNQLAIDDIVLNHVSLTENNIQIAQHNANKYAAINPLFAPYLNSKDEGSIWYKSYVNFETLSMTQNLNVGNNAYGAIVGADFPVVNLENGWKFLPTAYIGYNGGHQSFDKVSMYQNGGQGGFMGTFMKNDFIGAITAYAGGYSNEMSVGGATDYTGNWFAGTAAKLAYNLHPSEHFIIQPTAFISYNIFGEQNWNSDFGVMSMNSGLLNGINVAPGVNLIYNRETWSVYGTIQYMYNINDHVSGSAGNVDLPSISMRHGYIQYGVGATKIWKDRLNSYAQVTLRNGGRTGVGFQLGLQYFFDWGKKNKYNNAKTTPAVKKVIKSLPVKTQSISSNAMN